MDWKRKLLRATRDVAAALFAAHNEGPPPKDHAVNSFRDSLVQMMNAAPTDFIGHLATDVPDYV